MNEARKEFDSRLDVMRIIEENHIYREQMIEADRPPRVEMTTDENGHITGHLHYPDGTVVVIRGTFGPVAIEAIVDVTPELGYEIDYSLVEGMTIDEIIQKWKGNK